MIDPTKSRKIHTTTVQGWENNKKLNAHGPQHSLKAFREALIEKAKLDRLGPINRETQQKITKKLPLLSREMELCMAHSNYKLRRNIPLSRIEEQAIWNYPALRKSLSKPLLRQKSLLTSLDFIRHNLSYNHPSFILSNDEEDSFVLAKVNQGRPLTKYELSIYKRLAESNIPLSPSEDPMLHGWTWIESLLHGARSIPKQLQAFYSYTKILVTRFVSNLAPHRSSAPLVLHPALHLSFVFIKNLLQPLAIVESLFTPSIQKEISSLESLFTQLIETESQEASLFHTLLPHIFTESSHDTSYRLEQLFSGANFQLDDGGHHYKIWRKIPAVRTRISSHGTPDSRSKGMFLHSLGGEFLFWIDTTQKDRHKTCFQLERSTLIFSSFRVFRHTVDFFNYKITGLQQGPLGTSIHSDKNPIQITIGTKNKITNTVTEVAKKTFPQHPSISTSF